MRRTEEEPTWQPLSRLPLTASLIDAGDDDAQKQLDLLLRARRRPYVLDDHTVGRVVEVHTDALGYVAIYEEQLDRWRRERPSPAQLREIERLGDVLRRFRERTEAILALAAELSRGTIERTLKKRDIELGLEWLLGRPLSDLEDTDQEGSDIEDLDQEPVSEWAKERVAVTPGVFPARNRQECRSTAAASHTPGRPRDRSRR